MIGFPGSKYILAGLLAVAVVGGLIAYGMHVESERRDGAEAQATVQAYRDRSQINTEIGQMTRRQLCEEGFRRTWNEVTNTCE